MYRLAYRLSLAASHLSSAVLGSFFARGIVGLVCASTPRPDRYLEDDLTSCRRSRGQIIQNVLDRTRLRLGFCFGRCMIWDPSDSNDWHHFDLNPASLCSHCP